MNDDFSEVINKFSEILKEKNIDLNSIKKGEAKASPNSNFNHNTNLNSEVNSNSCSNSKESSSEFSLDIETIMKLKNILGKSNSCKDCPRNHLLNSLKPYLESEKKEKLEKYIQIANLINVMENMDLGLNFTNENKKGYDFLLIITLVLLIL